MRCLTCSSFVSLRNVPVIMQRSLPAGITETTSSKPLSRDCITNASQIHLKAREVAILQNLNSRASMLRLHDFSSR